MPGAQSLADDEPEYEPREIAPEELEAWSEHTRDMLSHSDKRLTIRVTWLVEQLRERGWPAKVTRAHRSLEEQRKSFKAGHSKTLRSKHLCGKAADINLFPHDYPAADHIFWDIKDELAKDQKLLVLNAPSFRDRPHVELDEDCDWDAVGLGPVGTWSNTKTTLVITRTDSGHYAGHLTRRGKRRDLSSVKVAHQHSGERNKLEDATVTLTFVEAKHNPLTLEVSTITSDAHGYRRADWRWLRLDDAEQKLSRDN